METGMLFVLFKLPLIQNKSQHYKKDQEHGDCIWMLAVFSRQLYYNLEISLEMFFAVKWSADGKCCLQDTDSRTIGEVTPGQNAILKTQGCSWSFTLVCNFLRTLPNMCHTWGRPLYHKTKHCYTPFILQIRFFLHCATFRFPCTRNQLSFMQQIHMKIHTYWSNTTNMIHPSD